MRGGPTETLLIKSAPQAAMMSLAETRRFPPMRRAERSSSDRRYPSWGAAMFPTQTGRGPGRSWCVLVTKCGSEKQFSLADSIKVLGGTPGYQFISPRLSKAPPGAAGF